VKAPVLYLVGPTGAGKSALAVTVAEAVGAEIMNADAFQLYRGLEILTAAPSPMDRQRVPHHLFGELGHWETCDAARYAAMARTRLATLADQGVPVLVVGGSGLYVKALSHGLSDLPSDPVVRAALAARPLDEKVAELSAVDPLGAAAMNLTNERYVDRALEIWQLTGRPASEARAAWEGPDPPDLRGVLLTREREDLHDRIDRRVVAMMDAGGIEEVAAAIDQASAAMVGRPFVSPTAEKAIGFREIRAFLAGRQSRDGTVAAIQQATRRYAKRQMTWFRRERWLKTVCLGADTTAHSAAENLIRDFFT